jgi:Uncharacterized protein conserved in bacteria (DUF2188)
VAAEGYVSHSLPYGTKKEAIEVAEELARQHPGSMLVVDDRHRACRESEEDPKRTASDAK